MLALGVLSVPAATLTVQTNRLGPTPEILAYNSGHFFPGSNTKDWWRYAGVTGARMFIGARDIESTDDIAGHGDGVSTQGGFLSRRAALRGDPLNISYINWPYFSNRFETVTLPGNKIRVNHACSQLRQLGIEILVVITASLSSFVINDDNDWAGKWELWQHYYAQAFHLSRHFDVRKFQMFNEPNHANANGLTQAQYLQRLQLASDAIQSAIADVNALHGKSLAVVVSAPVTSGSADGSYPGWGDLVVTNRHKDFHGQTDPNFWLLHQYAYHQYNSTPSSFGTDLADLHSLLTSAMATEPRFPTAITEFNVHTSATFDGLTETLDSPTKYSRLGAIAVNLVKNFCSELYCFKLSQTIDTTTVKKNGMHFVDNTNAPYNISGVTRGGEVWRLLNKGLAPGRDRLNTVLAAGATNLDVLASYDPVWQRYHLLSVNNTSGSVSPSVNLSAWNIPANNRLLVEEVSETHYGAGRLWTNAGSAQTLNLTQGSNSVWLFTIPLREQRPEQIVTAAHDAEVRDGSNKANNYGAASRMTARHDPTNTANRSAAFMKFNLVGVNPADVEFAVLSLQASTVSSNATAQAHVYGLNSNNWSQASITWNNAPNLRSNVAAGSKITNNVVADAGNTAHILGQLVVSSPVASERLVDVTDFIRGLTNSEATFLVAQEVRWDVTLPSKPDPDIQPDGVKMITTEGGNGPRLRLILPLSLPPVAVDDSAVTTQAVAVVIHVLANDSDPDGDPLIIQSFTQAANGVVTTNAGSTLTYMPNVGFYGPDSFNYTVSDGRGRTATAAVTVTVHQSTGSTVTVWTNLPAWTEANVRGGSYANSDVDEGAQGFLMVKYNLPDLGFARKAYFQFDLSGLNVNVNTQATFTVLTHVTNSFRHRAQLRGLNQSYPTFNANITWNTAQANETNSNNLLTNGALTASGIGPSVLLPGGTSVNHSFPIARIGDFIFGNRLTLVLSGAEDAANDPGGLRLQLGSAALEVPLNVPVPVVPTNYITRIVTNGSGGVTISFQGTPGQTYLVQTATNLPSTNWLTVSTNVAAPDGVWTFTDWQVTNFPTRFYRSTTP